MRKKRITIVMFVMIGVIIGTLFILVNKNVFSKPNEEWSKTYGGSGVDTGKSVQQTNDDGYIIAGYSESFGEGDLEIYLIKLAKEAELETELGLESDNKIPGFPPESLFFGLLMIFIWLSAHAYSGNAKNDVYLNNEI